MMGVQDCGNDLAAFIGENPSIDHKVGTFWCAMLDYYQFM